MFLSMNGPQNRDGELLFHLSGAELLSGSFPHSGLAWRPHKSTTKYEKQKHTTVLVTKLQFGPWTGFWPRAGSPWELRPQNYRHFAQNFDPNPMELVQDLKTNLFETKFLDIQIFSNVFLYIFLYSGFGPRTGLPWELRAQNYRRFAHNFDPDPMELVPDLKTNFLNQNY